MDITEALHSSAIGVRRATERINQAAMRLADPQSDDIVDPMVDLIMARRQAQANMTSFRAAARLNQTAVDILA